jgi:hypothetical protein
VISLIFKNEFDGDSSPGTALLRGLEGVVLSVLGGLMARAFISILLGSADDSAAAGLAVGWGFFLIPGIVDTIPYLTHSNPVLTTPESLLLFATVVGGMSGGVSGLWRIYSWTGLGWIGFPLDVTWALAGNTVGCLLHAINFLGYWLTRAFTDSPWGIHSPEIRENAHRYESGFGLRYHPSYAFTQGCVMSNLEYGPSNDLYRHEKTHVWQNRAFGPLYTLTYLGWIVVWVVPAVIAGIIVEGIAGVAHGPNNWCYFNNPWETWAYAVQGAERTSIDGVSDDDRKMIWPAKYVIAWSIPFFAIASALAVLIVVSAWTAPPPPSHKSKQPAHRPHAQLFFDGVAPGTHEDKAIEWSRPCLCHLLVKSESHPTEKEVIMASVQTLKSARQVWVGSTVPKEPA